VSGGFLFLLLIFLIARGKPVAKDRRSTGSQTN
jgi:hypothetical protein